MSTEREAALEARLAEAGAAWLKKQEADAHLQRLAQYKRMNKAMRDDRHRYFQQSLEASGTLSRVLGPQR